jgi:hypothetical protein
VEKNKFVLEEKEMKCKENKPLDELAGPTKS